MEVAIELVRSSPYQPRLYFDLEELKASINNDGMLVAALVREKPDEKTRYEIIDGERRWRAAKELNWRQIPIEIRNIDDETARRMVYTLNEERQPYTVEENTKFFRRMYDQMGSVYAVSQAFKRPESTIWRYINVSMLPEHFQKAVWSGRIAMGDIREMEPVFTQAREEIGGISPTWDYEKSPSYQKILAWCERIYKKEIAGTAELREQYVDPYLEALDRARIAKAREEVERIVPSHLIEATVKMETPEDLERAAEALRREARRRLEESMTAEERAAREAERTAKLEEIQRQAEERKRRNQEERQRLEEQAMRKARQQLKTDEQFVKEALDSMPVELRDKVVYDVEHLSKEELTAGKPPETMLDEGLKLEGRILNLASELDADYIRLVPQAQRLKVIMGLRILLDKIYRALETLTGERRKEVEGIIEGEVKELQ